MPNFLITDPNSNFITFGDDFNVAEKVVDVASILQTTLPDFVKEDYPKFVAFIEAYYEFMEQQNQAIFESKKILVNQDIDSTIDEFVQYFKKEFLVSIPENILSDKRDLIKNIKQFYRARGTEKSFSLLFRLLFNKEVEFYYPREDIFKSSDGKWIQEKSIKVWVVSGDPFLLESREIKGDSTGAVAVVENVVKYSLASYDVYELFLAPQSIYGTFIPDETITVTIPDVGDVVCRIYPVLTGVNIKQDTILRNLWTYTEPTAGTGYNATTGLTFQSASVLPVSGGEVVFGDNSTSRILRKVPSPALTIGQNYIFSFLIKMNDGSLPNQGTGNYRDFTLTINNADQFNYNNIKYDDLGNGVYRARFSYIYTGSSTSIYLQKYSGLNTAIGFKASAFQLEHATDITAYQKVVATYTPSSLGGLDYDTNTEVFIRDALGSGAKARIKKVTGVGGAVTHVEMLSSGVGYSTNTDIEFPIKLSQAYAEPVIGTVFMYPGYFLNEDGQLSTTKFLEDSYFYQQYSYVLLVDESINQYRDILKKILHPCGLIMFGGVRFVDLKVTDLHILNGTDDGHSTYTLLFNFFADASKNIDDELIAIPRVNLLEYTEAFDNAYWTKTRSTVIANTYTGPFGEEADKFNDNAVNSSHEVSRTVTITETGLYTFSVYAKKTENDFVWLYHSTNNQGSFFNLNTGVTGADVNGTPYSRIISNAGNGWYRCSIVLNIVATGAQTFYYGTALVNGTYNYIGTGTGIYILGAMLEKHSTPTAYQKVEATYVQKYNTVPKRYITLGLTPQKDPNSFGFGPSLRSIERDRRNYLPSPVKHSTENGLVPAPNLNYWQSYGNAQIKDFYSIKIDDMFNNQWKKINYHPDPYLKFESSDQLLLGYGNIAKSGDFNFDGSRSPSNFEYSDIRGLILWLDGADITTMYDATSNGSLVAVGGTVARWEDKSGNGFHATQATSANRPVRKVNIKNGLGSLFFDKKSSTSASGANYLSLGTTIGKPSEYTVFTVAQRTSEVACATLAFSSGANTQWGLINHGSSSPTWQPNSIKAGVSDGTNTTTTISSGSLDLSQYIIISARYTNGSNFVEIFANGVLQTVTKNEYASVVNSSTLAEGSVGRIGFFDSGYFHGYISEAIVYNRALSNTEMQWVHAKLSQKWAIGNISYPSSSIDVYPYSPKDLPSLTAWYDFGDNQTLYELSDGSGFQAIGGGTIGRVKDKTPNAYHASQSNGSSQPYKTIEPINGVRNIWKYTEPLSGTGYTVSENMTYQGSTVIGASRGEAIFGDATVSRRIQQVGNTTSGLPYIFSFKIKMDDNSVPNSIAGTYKDFTLLLTNSDINTGMVFTHLGNNVYQCYRAFTANGFPNIAIRKYAGLNSNTGFKVSEIQLELNIGIGGVPSPYQKVISQYEVTEVGQKHREGIFFDGSFTPHLIADAVAPTFQGDDTPFTIISVEKPVSNSAKTIFSFGNSGGTDYYSQLSYESSNFKVSNRRATTSTQTVTGTKAVLLAPQITTYVFNGTTSSLYTNGVEDWVLSSQNSATMSTNPNRFTVGCLRTNALSSHFSGNMHEMIVLSKAVTEKERLFLEAYLSKKWNIGAITYPEGYDLLPTDISDLVSWHDGLDEGSFFDATSGGNVVIGTSDISRWEDKSGNGYHATNSDSAKLPNRFIEPLSGRRNLLGVSYRYSDSAWGQNGTVTVTNNATTDPDLGSTATRINVTGAGGGVSGGSAFDIPLTALVTSQAYTVSAYLKANAGTNIVRVGFTGTAYPSGQPYVDFNISSGTISYTGTQAFNATITLDQNGYYRCSFNALTTATGAFSVYYYSSGGSCDWYMAFAQLELGTTLTAYQHVISRFNITERNVKNTYGLYCDGVDEFLELGPISKPPNWTIFVVGSKDGDATGMRCLIGTGNSGGSDAQMWGSMYLHSSQLNQLRVEYGDGTNYSITSTSNTAIVPNYDYMIASAFYGAGQADSEIYVQGTKQAVLHTAGTATSTNGTSYKTSFGRLGEFAGWYWKGRIKEVIIYNRKLTDSERQKIEYYLYKKWTLPNTAYSSTTLVPTKLSKVLDAYPIRSKTPILTGNTLNENLLPVSEDLTHNHIYKNGITIGNSSILNYGGASATISLMTETTGFRQKYLEYNEIRTISGETYTFEGMVKTNGKDMFRVAIGASYSDFTVSSKTVLNSGLVGEFTSNPTTGSWTQFRITYTAPSNGLKTIRISLIEARRNILERTETLENAYWTPIRSTVGVNFAPQPDLSSDLADKIREDTSLNSHYIETTNNLPLANSTAYTFSTYAQRGDRDFLALSLFGAGWNGSTKTAFFNLFTGALGTVASGCTATITNIGSGIYRCTISNSTATVSNGVKARMYVANVDNVLSYQGVLNNGIYVWGQDLELGSTATRYQEIVSGSEINVDSYKGDGTSGIYFNRLHFRRTLTNSAYTATTGNPYLSGFRNKAVGYFTGKHQIETFHPVSKYITNNISTGYLVFEPYELTGTIIADFNNKYKIYISGSNLIVALDDGSVKTISKAITNGKKHILSIQHTGGVMTVSVNGALGTTLSVGNVASITGNVIIGSGFIGKIGRFVTMKTIPTAMEERKVFDYFTSIFGL